MRKEKIWMLLIEGKEEGPFSFNDLRKDPRITPQTLARRLDSANWKKIGSIPELQQLFVEPEDLNEPTANLKIATGDDAELAMPLNPQNPLLILLIILILLTLIIFINVARS